MACLARPGYSLSQRRAVGRICPSRICNSAAVRLSLVRWIAESCFILASKGLGSETGSAHDLCGLLRCAARGSGRLGNRSADKSRAWHRLDCQLVDGGGGRLPLRGPHMLQAGRLDGILRKAFQHIRPVSADSGRQFHRIIFAPVMAEKGQDAAPDPLPVSRPLRQ